MSKRVATYLSAFAVAAAAMLAAGAGVASATPAAPATKVVPIVMADPGCHWFVVSGKKLAKLTVKGATTFRNLDEAALVFTAPRAARGVSANFSSKVGEGKTITISARGTYTIKMVGQYKHDNTLVLVVK